MSIYAKFYHGFDHDNMRHYQVSFWSGATINCKPPYIAGKMDSCWTSIRKGSRLPNPTDQGACENLLGMRLMPIEIITRNKVIMKKAAVIDPSE